MAFFEADFPRSTDTNGRGMSGTSSGSAAPKRGAKGTSSRLKGSSPSVFTVEHKTAPGPSEAGVEMRPGDSTFERSSSPFLTGDAGTTQRSLALVAGPTSSSGQGATMLPKTALQPPPSQIYGEMAKHGCDLEVLAKMLKRRMEDDEHPGEAVAAGHLYAKTTIGFAAVTSKSVQLHGKVDKFFAADPGAFENPGPPKLDTEGDE